MQFPINSTVDSWKPIVFHVISTNAATTEIRVGDIADLIEALPAFPGWAHWGTVTQRNEEYPVARRDMAFAASRLRDEGKVFSPVRGRYTMVAPAADAAPVVAEVVNLPSAPAPKVQMVAAAAVPVNDPLLVEDTGLRRMMISNTKCFGLYHERAVTCKTCPLAGFCHEAGKADYGNIAARLDAATLKSMEIPVPVAPAAPPAAPAAPMAPNPAIIKDLQDAARMANATTAGGHALDVATFKLFCSGCRGLIDAGVQFARVPNRGVFHVGCVN